MSNIKTMPNVFQRQYSRMSQLDGAEIQRRIDAGLCIRCLSGYMNLDKETGFTEHFCRDCRDLPECQPVKAPPKPRKKDAPKELLDLLADPPAPPDPLAPIRALLTFAGTSDEHSASVELHANGQTVSYRFTPPTAAQVQAMVDALAPEQVAQLVGPLDVMERL